MTGALICLAAAVAAAPHSRSRARLRGLHGGVAHSFTVRRSLPMLVLLCVPGYFLGGVPAASAIGLVLAVGVRRRARGLAESTESAERRKLLDALEITIGELRVGAHPAAACDAAAQESTGLTATAFAVAAARSRLGGSGAVGFRQSGPIGIELARIADAWSVAEKHGLALAEILAAAREDLLGRIRFRSRTESGLAGARATGAVLAGLPVVGIALGQMMGAAPLAVLCGGGLGGILLVVGTAFGCVGLLWTDAIVRRALQ